MDLRGGGMRDLTEDKALPKRPLQKLRHGPGPRLRVVLPVFHFIIMYVVVGAVTFLGKLGNQVQRIVNRVDHAISVSV